MRHQSRARSHGTDPAVAVGALPAGPKPPLALQEDQLLKLGLRTHPRPLLMSCDWYKVNGVSVSSRN